MVTLLDTIGPAIWRASWQAAALALVVGVVLRCCGERLSPRWRFLLWSVVLARFLCVATPVSPWSAFNVVPDATTASILPVAVQNPDHDLARVSRRGIPTNSPNASATERLASAGQVSPSSLSQVEAQLNAGTNRPLPLNLASSAVTFDAAFFIRGLTLVWLAGCLFLSVRLLATAVILRRRLSACRPVTDDAILRLFEIVRSRMGVNCRPMLLVTPDSLSPCVIGTWRTRIVLPESVVTQASTERLQHVLAHELAHLIRGDLWTNWLLLGTRILHWFNPIAWWTVREMQAEREAACDELAFAALGESERSAYAATIVELAASLTPSALAPGFVGLFSSTCRLRSRVERLLRSPAVIRLRAPIAVGLLLTIALLGLTDAMPSAKAQSQAATTTPARQESKTHTISEICMHHEDRKPFPGVTVRLYYSEGPASTPVEIAKTVTDATGRYSFTGLVPPRPYGDPNYSRYVALGFADKYPIGQTFHHFSDGKEVSELRIVKEKSTISGKVIDVAGKPIAGATVARFWIDRLPIPGLMSARTDADGRFKIDDVPAYKTPDGRFWGNSLAVFHPDYPDGSGKVDKLPADLVMTLRPGCVVTGAVTDGVTGKPAAKAVVTAKQLEPFANFPVATDAEGRFRVVVPEGRYDFVVDAKDRVCVAVTERECLAGEKLELPPFSLISGGFISGRVINTKTKQTVSTTEKSEPLALGFYGPSQPKGKVISPMRLAFVDKDGKFTLRAAPGENFPYFVNTRGVRMAWDTQEQPPVVVKTGETTTYDMLITPEPTAAEKASATQKVVGGLSKAKKERTEQILAEFRRLSGTVDETDLWCPLMRELVATGPDAVPLLAEELDVTTADRAIRRLAFAMRAIGDPRAVPALIRAIPKTLLPASSDYGLNVDDKSVLQFMQLHDLDDRAGTYFGFKRPVREVTGTLEKLTGQNLSDVNLFWVNHTEDPGRAVQQRLVYAKHARRWQAWWEQNWQTLTKDGAFQKVNLSVAEEQLPRAPQPLGTSAHLKGEWSGGVISPATEKGKHAWHFLDLDTGYQPRWPNEKVREQAARDPRVLDDWAKQNGIDLICVTHRSAEGPEVYVLQTFGMKVQEISTRDLRNIDQFLKAGKLPEGRPVGELLMHFDEQSQKLVPSANGVFLFVTSEGNRGVIETTDRITKTADLTGLAGGAPAGVGFHTGVQFNLHQIVP